MKPMLADDAVESKIQFPVFVQPKIDGVRGLNIDGRFTGRSLKLFGNRHTSSFFAGDLFAGFDGELAAAHECDPELCRKTSSATASREGQPFLLWWLFDYVDGPEHRKMVYADRYEALKKRVAYLQEFDHGELAVGHLRIVPQVYCSDLEAVLRVENRYLDEGYEGVILRSPFGLHKQGRSTVREGGLLRIKRFIEEEAVVIAIEEGQVNGNEAQTNELGHTFRTTHQANMTPNGMVGNFTCRTVKTGEVITVSPGKMPHDQRKFYFENQSKILGQVIKYKHFPKGVKDKPRFPTFQCIRSPEDM